MITLDVPQEDGRSHISSIPAETMAGTTTSGANRSLSKGFPPADYSGLCSYCYGSYHQDLLKGRSVVMGCPKLDDVHAYVQRLTEMIEYNDFKSITVAFMEVPCCRGIIMALEKAIENAGKDVVVHRVKINIDGTKETI